MVSLLDVGLPIVPGGAGKVFDLLERRQGRPHRTAALPERGDNTWSPEVLDLPCCSSCSR